MINNQKTSINILLSIKKQLSEIIKKNLIFPHPFTTHKTTNRTKRILCIPENEKNLRKYLRERAQKTFFSLSVYNRFSSREATIPH